MSMRLPVVGEVIRYKKPNDSWTGWAFTITRIDSTYVYATCPQYHANKEAPFARMDKGSINIDSKDWEYVSNTTQSVVPATLPVIGGKGVDYNEPCPCGIGLMRFQCSYHKA